jgi:hypothetical protein
MLSMRESSDAIEGMLGLLVADAGWRLGPIGGVVITTRGGRWRSAITTQERI